MLLLSIVNEEGYEDIMGEINEIKEYFEEKNILLGISESINLGNHFIKIFCNDIDYNSKLESKFNLYIANVLYKIVINEFCHDEIHQHLEDTYFFLRYEELKEIADTTLQILKNEEKITDEDMIYCLNKKNDIINKIKACVQENREINIQGFVTFRMKELKSELEDIINKVVEKYMAEKEYNEFIKLLKYFVEVQENKIDEVNIIVNPDGSYIIQDKKGKDIMNELLSDLSDTKYLDSVSSEDLIISGLITYCPEKIVIHCKENSRNKEIINTILNVFEDRVQLCSSCKMCDKVKDILKV